MGSEKKRKRRASEVEADSAAAAEKAERKRQKKLLREQKASEEGAPIDSDDVNSVPPLRSPIASRTSCASFLKTENHMKSNFPLFFLSLRSDGR